MHDLRNRLDLEPPHLKRPFCRRDLKRALVCRARGETCLWSQRYVKLLVTYVESYDALSDQLAAKILRQYLDIEKGRTTVKAKYLPRFEKVLPRRKVMRFFQADNKLDALVNAELAAGVPLAR